MPVWHAARRNYDFESELVPFTCRSRITNKIAKPPARATTAIRIPAPAATVSSDTRVAGARLASHFETSGRLIGGSQATDGEAAATDTAGKTLGAGTGNCLPNIKVVTAPAPNSITIATHPLICESLLVMLVLVLLAQTCHNLVKRGTRRPQLFIRQ